MTDLAARGGRPGQAERRRAGTGRRDRVRCDRAGPCVGATRRPWGPGRRRDLDRHRRPGSRRRGTCGRGRRVGARRDDGATRRARSRNRHRRRCRVRGTRTGHERCGRVPRLPGDPGRYTADQPGRGVGAADDPRRFERRTGARRPGECADNGRRRLVTRCNAMSAEQPTSSPSGRGSPPTGTSRSQRPREHFTRATSS